MNSYKDITFYNKDALQAGHLYNIIKEKITFSWHLPET